MEFHTNYRKNLPKFLPDIRFNIEKEIELHIVKREGNFLGITNVSFILGFEIKIIEMHRRSLCSDSGFV